MKRAGNLIEEIVERGNVIDAFNEVVGGLKEPRRSHYQDKQIEIINALIPRLQDGSFLITDYEEFMVHDGPKERMVQSPSVVDRIGCNAVVRVVERYVYPSVIPTSAASIKGRGMHKLFNKMSRDIYRHRDETTYFYKCDIRKFYASIDQNIMKQVLRRYVKDPLVLRMFDGFIEMMPSGLSIGLRSSQMLGNILLSKLDHKMKEQMGARYYYRYCDDIVVLGDNKQWLWQCRNVIVSELNALGLDVKASECVRPTTDGIDFLGFVHYGDHTRLRKRIKQNAARKLAHLQSRKRRQEVVGSFKGMARHADCWHLYKRLTNTNMKSFKELGLQYVLDDGKKHFDGEHVSLRELVNIPITILDFETGIKTENGERMLVYFEFANGRKGKYFTADRQQQWYLEQAEKMEELPFTTTIKSELYNKNKTRYLFT